MLPCDNHEEYFVLLFCWVNENLVRWQELDTQRNRAGSTYIFIERGEVFVLGFVYIYYTHSIDKVMITSQKQQLDG